MASHTHAKFGGRRHRGSGEIMGLVCYLISQDHAIKGSSNNMDRSPLKLICSKNTDGSLDECRGM